MTTLEERIESAPEPPIFTALFNCLLLPCGSICVLIWWFLVLLLGVFYGFDFLNQTVFEFSAPSGTPGYKADKQFSKYFPEKSKEAQMIAFFYCDTCSENCPIFDTNCTQMENMAYTLQTDLEGYGSPYLEYSDYYTTLDYFTYNNSKYMKNISLNGFINPAQKAAVALISYNKKAPDHKVNDFLDQSNDYCKHINKVYSKIKTPHHVSVRVTGQKSLVNAMNKESKKDVEAKDTLTIPLALCVLAFIIRSWRLMFIPLLTFVTSICASFSIMKPFATEVLNINPFTPSIMMSVSIAMSIDYSLFLLSRFREEVEKYQERLGVITADKRIEVTQEAVRQMTRWSGKVVALSGFILACTYGGLVLYPMEVLQSVGLGASVAILCTIWTNLTLTPALILTFPNFFSKFGWTGCPCERLCRGAKPDQFVDVGELDTSHLLVHEQGTIQSHTNSYSTMASKVNNPLENQAISAASQEQDAFGFDDSQYLKVGEDASKCDRFWYRCGVIDTMCPWSLVIVLAVYVAISPIGYNVFDIKKQLSDSLVFPRDSPYLATFNDVSRYFSAGYLGPWYITIPSRPGQTVYNTKDINRSPDHHIYLNDTAMIMHKFHRKLFQHKYYATILGVAYQGSIKLDTSSQLRVIDFTTISYRDYWNFMHLNTHEAKEIRYPYLFITEPKLDGDADNANVSYYQMTTEFDPFYKNAITFVTDARDYLTEICRHGVPGRSYNCYLTGGSIDEVDNVNQIFKNFPIVLGLIVAVVFCLVGFIFRSVFVPFRLFITIAIPITFVYGLAILTYQHGLFSALNVDALSNTDGLYWIIPIMTVTILIGLALDYDIFLFARIYEYRVMGGVPTRQAIIRGVYKTGSIITAAGCIMAIAFCGLLMSKITSLNQTGFIMVIAVLVDTFIIRTALVPAVLSMAKEINWWPGLRLKENTARAIRLDSNVPPLREGSRVDSTLDSVQEIM